MRYVDNRHNCEDAGEVSSEHFPAVLQCTASSEQWVGQSSSERSIPVVANGVLMQSV